MFTNAAVRIGTSAAGLALVASGVGIAVGAAPASALSCTSRQGSTFVAYTCQDNNFQAWAGCTDYQGHWSRVPGNVAHRGGTSYAYCSSMSYLTGWEIHSW